MNTTWLTGVSNDRTRAAARDDLYGRMGILLGPETSGDGAKADYTTHIGDYHAWGMDNGCFSNAGAFDERTWLGRLDWIVQEVPDAHDSCLFAVVPAGVEPLKSPQARAAECRGIEIQYVGQGYRKRTGPTSSLGQAIAEANRIANEINNRESADG